MYEYFQGIEVASCSTVIASNMTVADFEANFASSTDDNKEVICLNSGVVISGAGAINLARASTSNTRKLIGTITGTKPMIRAASGNLLTIAGAGEVKISGIDFGWSSAVSNSSLITLASSVASGVYILNSVFNLTDATGAKGLNGELGASPTQFFLENNSFIFGGSASTSKGISTMRGAFNLFLGNTQVSSSHASNTMLSLNNSGGSGLTTYLDVNYISNTGSGLQLAELTGCPGCTFAFYLDDAIISNNAGGSLPLIDLVEHVQSQISKSSFTGNAAAPLIVSRSFSSYVQLSQSRLEQKVDFPALKFINSGQSMTSFVVEVNNFVRTGGGASTSYAIEGTGYDPNDLYLSRGANTLVDDGTAGNRFCGTASAWAGVMNDRFNNVTPDLTFLDPDLFLSGEFQPDFSAGVASNGMCK
jgi:hypothetical protein